MMHSYKMLFAVLAMLAVLQGCSSRESGDMGPEFCDKLIRASVEVLASGRMAGSGAFVSSDGYVLTAAHYITAADIKLEVLSAVAGRNAAELIGIDKGHDIALLKIESEKELPFLRVSDRSPKMGQAIYVIGAPLNRHSLMLHGMVASGQADYEYLTDQSSYVHIWYVDSMSPRGLSGGNWVNSKGRVVGVQSGFLNEEVAGTGGNANSGVAFIAGTEAIRQLIKTKKHAKTTSIGAVIEELWTQSPGFQERFEDGAEGIIIHKVRPNGPLNKAGLVHEDMMVEVDGEKLRFRKELMEIVRGKNVGDIIEIGFVQPDGKPGGKKDVILDCLEDNWLAGNTE